MGYERVTKGTRKDGSQDGAPCVFIWVYRIVVYMEEGDAEVVVCSIVCLMI